MNISKSDIVISLAGRDAGKLFYVLSTEGEYALLADGKTRRLEKPKRKKLKHIRFAARIDSKVANKLAAGDPVLNSELRRDLAIFGQEFNSQNQGG
jgi:large subunit ribosomal protein L14e